MTRRVVRIHIRELVLEGVAPGDRYRVAGDLQAELVRLASSQSAASFAPSTERLDAGAVQLSPASSLGTQVARQIFGGLQR